jgi:hypothetical protein
MSLMTYDGVIKYVSYATVEPSSGNIVGGNISATGNISGNYFIGDGSQLTNLPGGATNYIVNGNSYANIATADGNLVINVGNDGYGIWTFETGSGNLIGPGNASQGAGIVLSADQSVYIREDMGELKIDSGSAIVITTKSGNVGNTKSWTFGTDGNVTLPGTTAIVAAADINLVANSAGNISGLQVNSDTAANLYAHTNVVIYTDSSGAGNAWTFDNAGALTLPAANSAQQKVTGTKQTILGDPFPAVISGTGTVTVWTADSDAVGAAKMTMRAQYGGSGNPTVNIEILDIAMAKSYPDGTPVFTISNRVKTNPAYADTLVDVTLAAGNVMQVTSSAPDATGTVYWTYSVTEFNQTMD